ncbi:hypothetical protein ACFL0V_01740 [Nanoarchaeota archaeon]
MKLARAIIGEFVPTMQPTYASHEEVMEAHGGRTQADVKYDGYRVQVHKGSRGVKIFTRNRNELNYACYPDLMKIVEGLPNGIIEAELVGEGGTHKQVFDNVKRRFRRPGIKPESVQKYLSSGIVSDVPLALRVFDVVKYGRREVGRLPLSERRKIVEGIEGPGIQPAETQLIRGLDELVAVIDDSFSGMQEGRVCKNPDSQYIPGRKGIDWVKFKRSETLDLVVVGFYKMDPHIDDPYTSVLCTTYNDETGMYETIGKIGVIRDGMAYDIHELVGENRTPFWPDNIDTSNMKKRRDSHVPNWWIKPEESLVLEVKAMNINYNRNWQSCGLKGGKAYSMRIAYATQIRHDKGPLEATKTSDVEMLYRIQEGMTEVAK